MTYQRFFTVGTVYHGPGSIASLPEEIFRLGGSRPGIVTDTSLVHAGIRNRVEQIGIQNSEWLEMEPAEPNADAVSQCAEFLGGRDLTIAIGGGSIIDTAKLASIIVTNGGELNDYLSSPAAEKNGLPLIAVPTTAGTGSEVTPAAVFKSPEDGAKKGILFP